MRRLMAYSAALLAFYATPAILFTGYAAIDILGSTGTRPVSRWFGFSSNDFFFSGPKTEIFLLTVVLIAVLAAVNALGFAIALGSHFRARRRTGGRFYAVSGALGIVCVHLAYGAIWAILHFEGAGLWTFPVICVVCLALSSLLPSYTFLFLSKLRVLAPRQEAVCHHCRYDLRATQGSVCPECGNHVSG